jgi:cytoskeletal protein CcmA (bactofilin family)
MFRSSKDRIPAAEEAADRVTSVLGEGISWQGKISGTGGVRIEGAFDGEIEVQGIVIVAERGRVTCEQIRAETVVIAGAVRGDIVARKVGIMQTGRVWGSVVTTSFSTEEGAFLRGEITMEEELDLGFRKPPEEADPEEERSEEEKDDDASAEAEEGDRS